MRTGTKERKAVKDERELLDFARSYLFGAFPNPERVGCPPEHVLKLLALQPLRSDPAVGEHLTLCSPCFKQYAALLARAKAQPTQSQEVRHTVWIKRSAAALAVAAMCVLLSYVFITKRHGKAIAYPHTLAPITVPEKPHTAIYVRVLIDLSNASPTRGTEQGAAGSVTQIIPSGSPLDLSLRLPLGSEERLYSITLMSMRTKVWSESAQARRQNGDTLLRVQADFRHITPGKYDLHVLSAGSHLTVPVLIKDISPKNTEPEP